MHRDIWLSADIGLHPYSVQVENGRFCLDADVDLNRTLTSASAADVSFRLEPLFFFCPNGGGPTKKIKNISLSQVGRPKLLGVSQVIASSFD